MPRIDVADWLPASAVAFLAVGLLCAEQGGYFPTSWGPAVVSFAAVVVLWLVTGARTDAGRRDLLLVACLGLLTAWVGLSTLWSGAPVQSLLEVQRTLVILVGVSAVVVLASRGGEPYLVFSILAGITAVAGYGLATRLAPGQVGTFDPEQGYRLSGPIGYWNGLGTFTAMGIVLAFGISIAGRQRTQRVLASIALVVLAPTLYFTFSRGAAVALICGLIAMFAITPRRIATLGALLVLAAAPVLAVAAASSSAGLVDERATLAEASADGHALLLWLCGLGVLAGCAAGLIIFAEPRLSISRRLRRAIGAATAAVIGAMMVALIVLAGGPLALPTRAVHSFDQPPKVGQPNLNDHLVDFSGSGRVDLWRTAISAYRAHPLLGIGSGTFERYWQKNPNAPTKARDAHSLYLETLTELGPVGLAILLAIGAIIVSSAVAARHTPVVPAAFGAFMVYAVHAGVEWDWELSGVTLTAFFAGLVGLISLRRSTTFRLDLRSRIAVGAITAVIAIVAAGGYVGNRALARGQDALDRNDPHRAVAETVVAARWAPWSGYPWTVRGEALLRLGDVGQANAAFREAIRKDPGYWRAWLGLAVASSGAARAQALDHASELYRNSPEIYQTSLLLRKQ